VIKDEIENGNSEDGKLPFVMDYMPYTCLFRILKLLNLCI